MSNSFDYVITIGGEAGQGMQTLGLTLTQALLKMGYYVSTLQSYQSRIRGGHNYFQVRLASTAIHSMRTGIDILIALDKLTLTEHCQDLSKHGVIIYDNHKITATDLCAETIAVSIDDLFPDSKSLEVLTNSVYLGMLAAMIGSPRDPFKSLFKSALAKKGNTIINQNKSAFDAGWHYIDESKWKAKFQTNSTENSTESMIVHGNQAIGLGAIAAGCKFYSAYPMTPSTSILDTLATHMDDAEIVVEQAEDEIAALNMVLGASYGGIRAMTGTSGGGLALMVEAISLAGITECPAVVVDSQRPGPATGLPTRTEQADLEFVIYSGHGEFPKVVLTPGNHKQCFELTMHAFNLAEQFQIPVFILTDQYLADWYSNTIPFNQHKIGIDRGRLVTPDENYERYQLSDDGISARAFPGKGKGLVIVDSDEHTEDGHLTEDLTIRIKMNEKRLKKTTAMKVEMLMPDVYGTSSAIAVLCWGSSFGPCLDAVTYLQNEGLAISLIHFKQCWPLDENRIETLLTGYHKLIMVEGNISGQLAHILRGATSIHIKDIIHRYDGKPFLQDELTHAIKSILSKEEE